MEKRDIQFIRRQASVSETQLSDAPVKDGAFHEVAPGPVCLTCRDTGWVATGQDKRMARCHCFLETRASRLALAARIPTRYAECTFSNFCTDGNPALTRSKIDAEAFVSQYPLDKMGLMFVGSIGTGKTHLAVAIIKELIRDKCIPCLFYDYRELLKQIQDSYNNSVQTTELELLRPVFEAEVLVLDEFGATRCSDWIWDTVSFILNTRYNDKRTTIVTTNFPNLAQRGGSPRNAGSRDRDAAERSAKEDTLGDRIGERMRSRLHEMCRIVHMEGEDYRQKFRSASLR